MRPFRLAALLLCLLPATAGAQALWPRPRAGTAEFGLEWVRPTFENEDGIGFSRGVWVLDVRARASDRLNVIIAFPYLNAPSESGDDGGTLGNVMGGVEFTDTAGRPEFTIGLRRGNVSTSSFGPFVVGALGDYDRLEQAATDGWILNTVGHVRPWSAPDGGFAELRFGVTGIFGVDDGGSSSTSMLLDYGIRIGSEKEKFGFGAGLTGRWPITGTYGGSVASAVHQVFADASYLDGMVQPTVGVRFPFDEDLGEVFKYALTFGVKVVLE